MNPIKSLAGVVIPTPSKYKITNQDVSLSGAGRTMDAKMQKKKIAQKIKIELSWNKVTLEEGQKLLSVTNSEYFNVTFLGFSGNFETKEFYRGDINAELYGEPVNQWLPFSFNIIER